MAKEFATPLRLVTPHMRGIPVRDAQWLLQGHNRFAGLAPYKDGKLDSDYGPMTAQATARTKYWLGYPDRAIDQVFGQTLYEYLRKEHWRPLPDAYRERRAARLKAAASTPGLKALAEGRRHLGYRESPFGSNRTIFGQWYGWNGVAWCAIFLSYCFAHSGWSRFHYASVEMIYYAARAGRDRLRIVYTPQAGDVVLYQLHGDPWAHTAFFDRWIKKGQTFHDLGGNTGPSNISNGGMVLEQTRSISQVHAFVRAG